MGSEGRISKGDSSVSNTSSSSRAQAAEDMPRIAYDVALRCNHQTISRGSVYKAPWCFARGNDMDNGKLNTRALLHVAGRGVTVSLGMPRTTLSARANHLIADGVPLRTPRN